MSESRTIRFFKADDWVWVFADERCVYSGHSIDGPELLQVLSYEEFETYWERPDNPEEALWGVDDSSLDAFPVELFERTD